MKFKPKIEDLGKLLLFLIFILIFMIIRYYKVSSESSIIIKFFEDFYANILTELLSIAFTILIINALYDLRDQNNEKKNLRLQMSSPDNAFAREAIRKLKLRGWFYEILSKIKEGELRGANLCNEDFSGISFENLDLSDSKLCGVNFARVIFNGVILCKAEVKHSNLIGAEFKLSNLAQADFSDSDLSYATFKNTSLQGSIFINSNLTNTIFYNSDLSFANLTSSELKRCRFSQLLHDWL